MLSRVLLGTNRLPTAATILSRFSTSPHNLPTSTLAQGDRIHGFTVDNVVECRELSLVATELTHSHTGARHIHINRPDPNNTFAVSFRTTPLDSTGVPHILEHTALCGSRLYPCRDPFFKMLNRSLATFMNAFTSPDMTVYPFSSQNSTDFYNLMGVYLDAAFFPLLRENDFRQEGWRLEFEDNQDKISRVIFKGVVFNEMKGVMADRDDLFSMSQGCFLLPDHTYSHNFGGDPLEIPRLSWEALRAFHSTHYHPSNAIFYTYGDLPVEQHLERISGRVLEKFEKIDAKTEIPLQSRWEKSRHEKIYSPPDPMSPDPSKQTAVSVSYLLDPTADVLRTRRMSVLSKLLMDGPNSPFFQSLIESNIGLSYSPGSGYAASGRQATFGVGLKGVKKRDVEKITGIIQNTFENSQKDGFAQDRIEGIIHQMELSMKRDSARFGLDILHGCLSVFMHGASLVDIFSYQEHLDQIKAFSGWGGLVKESFIENPHKLTLVMEPSSSFQRDKVLAEERMLTERVGKLTDTDKETLFQSGLELQREQNKVQDVSSLPCLSVSDISREQPRTQLDHASLDGTPVQICPLPTNGVTYLSFLADEDLYPDGVYRYLPLLCSVLTNIGACNMDHRQRAKQIERYTSGLSMVPLVIPHHTDLHSYDFSTYFRSHCLEQNLETMLALWQDTFQAPDFSNREIIRSILSGVVSEGVGSISHNGHLLAMAQAAAPLNPASELSEELSGLSQIRFLNDLAKQTDLLDTISVLQTLAAKTLHTVNLKSACNLRGEVVDETLEALSAFFDAIPGDRTDSTRELETGQFVPMKRRVYTKFPFQVHFVARAIQTVTYNHPDQPILSLLARIMTNKVLHPEIREKGGAYGGGARQGENSFYFFSYRDPNFLPTLQVYERAVDWVLRGGCAEQDLLEAKLAMFQVIDAPVTSGKRGSSLFRGGITHEMKQRRREIFLDATRDQLVSVCRQYLSGDVLDSVAVLGPEGTEVPEGEGWQVSASEL